MSKSTKLPLKKGKHDHSLCNEAGQDGFNVREFLTRVGDKWTILIIVMLSKAPGRRARFSELQKMVPSISQRMLTTTLRNLERDGMLTREVFPEIPPRVEYELTPLGLNVLEPLEALIKWVEKNWAAVQKAREKFDRQ